MHKSILFGLTLLAIVSVASVAQAGLLNRGGGCHGGRCGAHRSARLDQGPDLAQVEATPSEIVPGDEAVAEDSENTNRFGRMRGFFRRR